MAAPEYLLKLKFGTEVDKKAFAQIEDAYNNLNRKQQATFAKRYGSTIQETDKLFKKQAASNLKDYEDAALKTEKTLTAARVKELRGFITKRNQQLKRLPGYAASAAATGALLVANSAINNSFAMTSFEKNMASNGLQMAGAGAASGAMVAGIPGAVVGAIVGGATGLILADIENDSEAIKRSAELFNQAVNTYKATLETTRNVDRDAQAAGFGSNTGQYVTYKAALQRIGFDNDAWYWDLLGTMLGQGGENAAFAKKMMAGRRDAGINAIYERFQNSGLSADEFIRLSAKEGGLGQSDGRAQGFAAYFRGPGLQHAINQELEIARQEGVIGGGANASTLSNAINVNTAKQKDLDSRTYWGGIKNIQMIEDINMNADIVTEQAQAFKRSLALMKESNIILAGVNVAYKKHEKELNEIFSRITKQTGVGTVYGEQGKAMVKAGDWDAFFEHASSGGLPRSLVEVQQSKWDKSTDRINMSRIDGHNLTGVGGF